MRRIAISKLDDQAVLVEIMKKEMEAWKDPAPRMEMEGIVRQEIVYKLEDQALLAEIARTDPNAQVRREAVYKLDEQTLLAEFEKQDGNAWVRLRVAEGHPDQKLLADIAKNDKDEKMRIVAIRKLTDQAALAEIARNDEKKQWRWKDQREAIKKLTDQAVLTAIALSDEDSGLRSCATAQLTDQAVLTEIVRKYGNIEAPKGGDLQVDPSGFHWKRGLHSMCATAVSKITDQTILAEFAKDAENQHRRRAIARLTDLGLLAEVAKTEKGGWAHLRMAEILDDKAALAEIEANAENDWIRIEAASRLRPLVWTGLGNQGNLSTHPIVRVIAPPATQEKQP